MQNFIHTKMCLVRHNYKFETNHNVWQIVFSFL